MAAMSDPVTAIELVRPDWTLPVKAGFTRRYGGVSQPPYDRLNLALHVGDDPMAVHENRRRLIEHEHLPEPPRWLSQVHGRRVVHASDVERDRTEADAVWTDQPGQVCAVLIADCIPILLASDDGDCVAAVHAGWRGLVAGVIQQTVAAMPVTASRISACIGPCIGPDAYEVGAEVVERMMTAGVEPQLADGPPSCMRPPFHLDLSATARCVLDQSGVARVHVIDAAVRGGSNGFYSHRGEGTTGRMAGLIAPPSRP
ncbi:hypothetical protein SPICUR_02040 [Spiribacter curvatus]|uniref:Purine nucleoside phosphorylase n=2 Tax=Spiribacter curvatus TaxID=1335757 RepID=U5T513_9GAMM|nr:hypothetical protein SPICUR_02040 [Spiribacter curvatus]